MLATSLAAPCYAATPAATARSRARHWASTALFPFLVALGTWMTELDYYDRWQPITIRVHRAGGIAALALVAARLLWRAWDTRPHPHPGLAHWNGTCRWGCTGFCWRHWCCCR